MIKNIKYFIRYMLNKEFVRFIVVGGLNTVIGYTVTLFLFMILNFDYKLSQLLNFILCFPISYSLQAIIAFRTKWSIKRMFIYPLSSIPNYAMQFGTLLISVEIFRIPEYIGYLISYIVPIPVMFFIIRFMIKPLNNRDSK